MLRNGRTGHTWHLVVDYIMFIMKMRSSSPANRPAKRMYVHVQKKEKKWLMIYSRLSPATGEGRLSMVIVTKKSVYQ